jgi:uncharacterized membrane protein YbaN (DUF454 family)
MYRVLLIILGSLSLALGIIGIFLPILPTTPFLLLSATLYFRSSPKLYNWLLNQKQIGPYIRHFREHKAIPLRAKIISISMIWVTLLYCTFTVTDILGLQCLFITIAAAITYHILSYKTLK